MAGQTSLQGKMGVGPLLTLEIHWGCSSPKGTPGVPVPARGTDQLRITFVIALVCQSSLSFLPLVLSFAQIRVCKEFVVVRNLLDYTQKNGRINAWS